MLENIFLNWSVWESTAKTLADKAEAVLEDLDKKWKTYLKDQQEAQAKLKDFALEYLHPQNEDYFPSNIRVKTP